MLGTTETEWRLAWQDANDIERNDDISVDVRCGSVDADTAEGNHVDENVVLEQPDTFSRAVLTTNSNLFTWPNVSPFAVLMWPTNFACPKLRACIKPSVVMLAIEVSFTLNHKSGEGWGPPKASS